MAVIVVQNTGPLTGEIEIQGSKNAVLPMMAAALLAEGRTTFTNVPRIQDVFCMMGILQFLGCPCSLEEHTLTIDGTHVEKSWIPQESVAAMRSSIMLLGPLLARNKEAKTWYPGGCLIGKRPIDLHEKALTCLGAEIREEDGKILAETTGLTGGDIVFPYPSVGATENAVMAAVMAKGVTHITGAAREPEIQELCLLLNQMGADIEGIGSGTLTITGVQRLSAVTRRIAGDRIVAGTYLAAVMACRGKAVLKGINASHLEAVLERFSQSGARFTVRENDIQIIMERPPEGFEIITGPYPEFPTDLQSQAMAVMAAASGNSKIVETVFESRFGAAEQLKKLGARIQICGKQAEISGICGCGVLKGTQLEATDLRGGAAAVIGGLAAEGRTAVTKSRHIKRGYEDICRDLRSLGADVWEQVS
mgnify:FL=1